MTARYVVIVGDVDEQRYLAKGPGYVKSSAIAMDKLECVPADYQAQFSVAARRRDFERLRADWRPRRETIERELNRFQEIAGNRLRREVRNAWRSVARLDHRVDDSWDHCVADGGHGDVAEVKADGGGTVRSLREEVVRASDVDFDRPTSDPVSLAQEPDHK